MFVNLVFYPVYAPLYGLFLGGGVSAYRVLGGLLVIMLWMDIVSQLPFFGAELSKVVAWSEPLAGAP